jgi:hypothetical protein
MRTPDEHTPFQTLTASLPYRGSLLSDDLAFFEWLQRQAVSHEDARSLIVSKFLN